MALFTFIRFSVQYNKMSLILIVNVVKDKLDDSGKRMLKNQDEKCKTFLWSIYR